MPNLINPKIVILDGGTLNPGDNSWAAIERLGRVEVYDRTEESQLFDRAKEAGIVVTNKVPITDALLSKLPALRFIAVTATGFNIVDTVAARKHGILVANVPEYGTHAVAQYTFALILELCHGVERHVQSVKDGQWQRSSDWSYWLSPQTELAGKKLGIVGFGRIGRRVGELAHAFGMEVLAIKPTKSQLPDYQSFRWASLEQLFSEADFITLHCPQTDANKQMVNDILIRRMKSSAFLINTARGGLIHEADLADHLNRGTIGGAALDVVSAEPIRENNPLLHAKNCILTPHIAWAAIEARRRLVEITAANISAFLAGDPKNVVNR